MLFTPTKIIIISMFLQVFLTFSVMVIMGRRRFAAARKGDIPLASFKTMQLGQAPENVQLASRNFENQFEIPVLFFVACLLGLHLQVTGWFFAVNGALFVVSRVAHSWVHLTNNHVLTRFRLFMLGCLFVLLQWLTLVATFI
ncbi:MAPEG family protein [Pseudoalteromonas sp. MMG022]|uniref:MAPEG family protein n=1 Tax=Pseudoalteromonas sp. MMG022 TaxID=2909978 RepID=UPI0023B2A1ED|nr:MAPEG family protein [Pseudoalteromonas sp. MMG022]